MPGSGSFIRPSAPSITCGVSFLKALSSKYIEALHGSETAEKVTLGSSNGAIEVEAVGLDKIRKNLSHLERLREVSLDNGAVAMSDSPGRIKSICLGEYCPICHVLEITAFRVISTDIIGVQLPCITLGIE